MHDEAEGGEAEATAFLASVSEKIVGEYVQPPRGA